MQHKPVLLHEVIEHLAIREEGTYVDATFGRGGHSKAILQKLSKNGHLLVIDKDIEATSAAQALRDERVIVRQGSFTRLREWVEELEWSGKVNGVLLDLGVSSPQLDEAERGFSFMQSGPLDMRMDVTQKLTAAAWINSAKASEMEHIFRLYGEERFSKRIANAIAEARARMPIETTGQLAEIVKQAHPRWEVGKHPATRVFQAIRIFINDELSELRNCLEQCLEVLAVHGRLLVISFHSLEDRIVKDFMYKNVQGGDIPIGVPIRQKDLQIRLKRIGRAIRASDDEVRNNPRARSATLRVMEKVL
jgi:16S rRNA (cytosine1402-N4)-methyltransferase